MIFKPNLHSTNTNEICTYYSEKTHFIFSRLEKQKGPLWCIDTRFLHGKFAVRASRHSREGRFALQ